VQLLPRDPKGRRSFGNADAEIGNALLHQQARVSGIPHLHFNFPQW
jgi:hypothetical protein